MPGEEIPGGVGNTSGDAGALCAPARLRHRGDKIPGHPSTGNRLLPSFAGKCILYIMVPPFVWGGAVGCQ